MMHLTEIEKIFQLLIPSQEMRNSYLSILLESINIADSYGKNKWGVHCKIVEKEKIRLLVGNVVILTIGEQYLWLALDQKLLDTSKISLENKSFWKWDEKDYSIYKSINSKNGYYISSDLIGWDQIKNLHFEAIKNAANKYSYLNKRSQFYHSDSVLDYIALQLNCTVPKPSYSKEENSLEEINFLPEEIENDKKEQFYEGAVKQITVNSYERDVKARQKCIEIYGLNCAVCGFNFEEKYGKLGKNFIHIHHLNPLSEIREEYIVNPERDLRPVCPNCHAMLHRKKEILSIEELKDVLSLKK